MEQPSETGYKAERSADKNRERRRPAPLESPHSGAAVQYRKTVIGRSDCGAELIIEERPQKVWCI